MARALADHQQRLDWLDTRLIHPAERLAQRQQAIAALGARLQRALGDKIERGRLATTALGRRQFAARPRLDILSRQLDHVHFRLAQRLAWRISEHSGKLNSLANSLKQLDPHAVLQRGYALAIGPDGRAVRDAEGLSPGDSLELSFARGMAMATVKQVVAAPEAD
jgi:exodeoxyribonuclease VII large subunit